MAISVPEAGSQLLAKSSELRSTSLQTVMDIYSADSSGILQAPSITKEVFDLSQLYGKEKAASFLTKDFVLLQVFHSAAISISHHS